ncbi:glycerate dehydrogenase [Candidatus Epulonipiscium fishelsonii]|uniref:Glycerate dehydrogenase n=1 Tax=Candidatus Epulonipiscium fishelsonii TaxID=77094 RepID=A0ACC8XF41_9FIRM|nr:glycerate dehydrogenase [Epulopiscium sp. SCG-B11WGA-EpuloA1]ONI47586.1 glycerate dehydrogenase [Epulopiscium sp. SCG-C06WGA-EpuloA1]
MKIVVLDGYTLNPGDLSWKALEDIAPTTVYDRTAPEDIVKRIGDADIVFTNKTPITKETLDKTNIKWIGILATGYNVVDIDAAKAKGIPVCNVPTYGNDAVGQFAIALLLELCHHIGHHSYKVRHEGEWQKRGDFCFWDYPLIELVGKTMGIIGFGRNGQSTAKIARALGMNVIAYDKFENPDMIKEGYKYVSLDELLAKSDVISLHCPLFPENTGIINKENIAKMKDGVFILNTARGPLVNEQDLTDALNSGKVGGAGLDVVSSEPIKDDNPLLTAKNCIITPHIAWAPKEARNRLLGIAVNNLKEYLKGNTINAVNM